jgi:Tol biopolymer transport system component
MDRDGSNLQQITWSKYSNLNSPRVINNGRDIVYSGDLPYDGKFFNQTNGGTIQTLLSAEVGSTNSPQAILAPPPSGLFVGAWGTDLDVARSGTEILFVSDRLQPFHYDIFGWQGQMNAPKPLGLISVSRYNQNPRWLPGQQAILFLAATEWNSHSRPIFSLWRADADGSNPQQLADSSLFTSPHLWQPTDSIW